MRLWLAFVILLLTAGPSQAVIVRGKVTTPLGAPLPGCRVQLIRLTGGARNAADTISGNDGSFEIRTSLAGRFLLLTTSPINVHQFAPQIGSPFYGGRKDILTLNVALDYSAITPQLTPEVTGLETTIAQLSEQPTQIAADQFLTPTTPLTEIAETPAGTVVQYGQTGSPASLYLRGVPVSKIMIDGVSAETIGGGFNLGLLTTGGLGAVASAPTIEIMSQSTPLDGLNAGTGILALHPLSAATSHPVLNYSVDAGGLSSLRNSADFGIAYSRADALISFLRFNTDNDLPALPTHLITSAANLGYQISGLTSLRLVLRQDITSAPLSVPYEFYKLQPLGKEAAQNIYGSITFETSTLGLWHNQFRYGLARERNEYFNFETPAIGLPVTIKGANGYVASGTATFPVTPSRQDYVTNRDEYIYQTDFPISRFSNALIKLAYADERGAILLANNAERTDRGHFEFSASIQGRIRHRFFLQASGFLDESALIGLRGSPRLGMTYVPVRPGSRKFRGTSLHLTIATGVREPTVQEEANLPAHPDPARSRAVDAGLEQNLFAQKLIFRATYFHQQISHDSETLSLNPTVLSDSLAYRTQGLELGLKYRPRPRLLFHGGYNYLAALVEQSAEIPVFNPSFPTIPVGVFSALRNGRPFHRPPESGFVSVQVTGPRLTADLSGVLTGKSDDSTALSLSPPLLLPNRNLLTGYASLNGSLAYAISHSLTVYSRFSNLLDNRHIAPIGYLSTPFLAQAGIRVRLGRE